MVGVMASPPMRLAGDARDKLRPLLTKLETAPAYASPYWFGMPMAARDGELILLALNAHHRVIPDDRPKAANRRSGLFGEGKLNEITSATILNVEIVSRAWQDAWSTVNQALDTVIALSQTTPGAEKRQKIVEALDRGAAAVRLMNSTKPDEAWFSRIREIEPAARMTQRFQRQTREEWQQVLEQYAARLGLVFSSPLPPVSAPFDPVKVLAESASPGDMRTRIRELYPPDTLEAWLIHSPKRQRALYVYEALALIQPEFDALRDEARRQMADREKQEASHKEPRPAESIELKDWNLTLRLPGDDVLAQNLVLSGALVEKIHGRGPGIDLKPGDLILHYGGTYDMAMGVDRLERTNPWLKNKRQRGGTIKVLRGGQIIDVQVPKD
jgi:hypothetical protein